MASQGKLPESLDPKQMSLDDMDADMGQGLEPQVGDVVELRSGSPAMTVIKVEDDGLTCVWFAESEERFREQVLPAAALVATIEVDDEDMEEEDEEEEESEDEDGEDEDDKPSKRRRN